MSSAAQVLRQAEALKATVADPSKNVSEVWVSRQKLEDLYKKLLLMDLEYALDKKVEQDLWNHAFKNQINSLQSQAKDNQNPKRGEVQASLNLFLETASGFYLQLLQLICTTFKLDLPFRRKSSTYGIMKERSPLKTKITPPKKNSCLYICQHCLVHLGDIARYRQEVDQAQTYYWHAANLVPSNGQPYNQLAILEAARGNKLSTVFYYIRSLAVRHPFPVAATNLEKFYAKLTKDMTEFKGKLSMSEVITAFLQFHALIHLSTDYERAASLSEKLLASLPAHVTSQSFSTPVLVQIVTINLFTMHHARRQMNDGAMETNHREKQEELSKDEQRGFELVFKFTVLLLDILLHYTPKQEQKLRDFFTLPAIKILLDWLWAHPLYFYNHFLKSSCLWSSLSKLLNLMQDQSGSNESQPDITQYTDVPLPEDFDLRCFQPIEKAHSNYSFQAENLPLDIETNLRCLRLVNYGKWIAEKCSDLRILSMQTTKNGKLHFIAPNAQQGKVSSGGELSNVVIEKKPVRQNVAIQAIIQKQNQSSESNSLDKEVKPITKQLQVKGSMENQNKLCNNPNPPRYLLGVPTTDPQFMKPGANRQVASSTSSSSQSSSKPATSHQQSPTTAPLNFLPPSPTPSVNSPNQFTPPIQYRGPSTSFQSCVGMPPSRQPFPVSPGGFPRRGPYMGPPPQIQTGPTEMYASPGPVSRMNVSLADGNYSSSSSQHYPGLVRPQGPTPPMQNFPSSQTFLPTSKFSNGIPQAGSLPNQYLPFSTTGGAFPHPFNSDSLKSQPQGQNPTQLSQQQLMDSSLQKALLNSLPGLPGSLGISIAKNNCSPTNDNKVRNEMQQPKEEFHADNSDFLGSFSRLAIQPPKPSQVDFLASSKPFQGHAEGVPKPDSPAPGKSLLGGIETEMVTGNSTELNSHQGTYSLFSSSPWSVHITAAGDSKSLGSSPFSSQASSIRNSPDPLSEPYSSELPTLPSNFPGLGFSFNTSSDQWGTQTNPPPPVGMASTASSLLAGNIQSLWAVPGPSPLERLLEVQKQRQNDPH